MYDFLLFSPSSLKQIEWARRRLLGTDHSGGRDFLFRMQSLRNNWVGHSIYKKRDSASDNLFFPFSNGLSVSLSLSLCESVWLCRLDFLWMKHTRRMRRKRPNKNNYDRMEEETNGKSLNPHNPFPPSCICMTWQWGRRVEKSERMRFDCLFARWPAVVDLIRRIRTGERKRGRDGWMPGMMKRLMLVRREEKKNTIHSHDRHWKSIVGNGQGKRKGSVWVSVCVWVDWEWKRNM